MITLAEILTPSTEEEALATCLEILDSLGFTATSWQSGSRQRTVVQMFARVYAAFTVTIASLASMGLNETASGDWLTLFSASHYDNTRRAAVKTQGAVVLTASSAAPGPFTIAIGQLVFADVSNGYTYRNTTGGTLNASGTLSVSVEAETAGANRDVAGSTITIMKTPLAGVTCNNAADWITRNGSDLETDSALRERNRSKWGTLGIAPGTAYQYYAAMGHESVRRVWVDDTNPRGPGTLDIYLAGDSGAVAGSVVTAVTAYMDGTADGVDRTGSATDLLVASAANLTVSVTGTVYLLKQYDTAATRTAINAAIEAFFKTVPIGGTRIVDGGLGSLRFGALAAAIYPIAGVQNVAFVSPVSDVPMTVGQVAVPTVAFSYAQV